MWRESNHKPICNLCFKNSYTAQPRYSGKEFHSVLCDPCYVRLRKEHNLNGD